MDAGDDFLKDATGRVALTVVEVIEAPLSDEVEVLFSLLLQLFEFGRVEVWL
jgi:hypothetical protein